MTEASLVGVFRTIIIILLVYYIFKWLTRLFFPLLVKKYFGNQMRKQEQPEKEEGDITIIKGQKRPEHDDSKVGEYVDYEEVDE